MQHIFRCALIGLTALGMGMSCYAADDQAMASYDESVKAADAVYERAKKRCEALKDNEQDICGAEAKAARTRAKAHAEAELEGTARSRRQASDDIAKAEYEVAKEKCDDRSGNDKDICVKEAQLARTKAMADAKAAEKSGKARAEANREKNEARRDMAEEKCESLNGQEKETCEANAKSKGK